MYLSGSVAQWLARQSAVREIAGSIPGCGFCKNRRFLHENLILLAVRGLAGILNKFKCRIHQALFISDKKVETSEYIFPMIQNPNF